MAIFELINKKINQKLPPENEIHHYRPPRRISTSYSIKNVTQTRKSRLMHRRSRWQSWWDFWSKMHSHGWMCLHRIWWPLYDRSCLVKDLHQTRRSMHWRSRWQSWWDLWSKMHSHGWMRLHRSRWSLCICLKSMNDQKSIIMICKCLPDHV